MFAAGFRAGLSDDLAPRVPVALFSIGFLAVFFWLLRREFSLGVAASATMILATSGMWLAYSGIGVTDIPMSGLFGLAALCILRWTSTGERRYVNGAAAALGLAFLAKSGPPLVLALPALWFGRDKWRDLFRARPLLLFLVIALPWYILCYLRNGREFVQVLFVQQQFQRITSPILKHVQPWWFYFKWLPAALFPWTPLLGLLGVRSVYSDRRVRYLAVTVAWGLLFFSISPNKLPGYILPLLPPLAILAAIGLDQVRTAGRILAAICAVACCAFPLAVKMLPVWMSKDSASLGPTPIWLGIAALAVAAGILFVRNRTAAIATVAVLACTGYLTIKVEDFPAIDAEATARPLAHALKGSGVAACVKIDVPRDLRYGLNYYTEIPLPDCGDHPHGARIDYRQHRLLVEPGPGQ